MNGASSIGPNILAVGDVGRRIGKNRAIIAAEQADNRKSNANLEYVFQMEKKLSCVVSAMAVAIKKEFETKNAKATPRMGKMGLSMPPNLEKV